jgi:hypothetical protein
MLRLQSLDSRVETAAAEIAVAEDFAFRRGEHEFVGLLAFGSDGHRIFEKCGERD